MKLIESKAEVLIQEEGLQGIYKMIELAGRTCYKSEANITPDSAKEFVERMMKSGHTAMLEHGTVYLAMPMETVMPMEGNEWYKYHKNPYSKGGIVCEVNGETKVAATTNYRVLVENNWLGDLQYLCEPTEFHKRRISIKFVTDRGVSHELVRHRVFSFAQESTRYCNYSKDKFGNELTFIIPSNFKTVLPEGHYAMKATGFVCNDKPVDINSILSVRPYLYMIRTSEEMYMKALEFKATPQEARQVLPNALKTEIVMTGFLEDWRHFFHLRYFGTTGKPHPDMLLLATKAKEALEEAGLFSAIMNSAI